MLTIDYIQQQTNASVINPNTKPHGTPMIDLVDFDSRRLQPNSLYVALTIGETDGHLYIEQAIKQGAVAVFVSKQEKLEEAWLDQAVFLLVEDTLTAFQTLAQAYRHHLDIPVIGITGSNGKTTSKDLISSLLGRKLSVHKTHGNFNNHLGVPLTLLQAKPSHDVIVLEMGMNHAGELDVLGRMAKPNYVVITNIGESHIEHLGSRENIAEAKGELLAHLQKDGIAFLPGDSTFCSLLANKTDEKKIIFNIGTAQKGFHPERLNGLDEQQIFAQQINVREGFTFFDYGSSFGGIIEHYYMPLYGEHNVRNALPAIYLAKLFGLNVADINKGLEKLRISPMRFERMIGRNDVVIINDAFNASPTSMTRSSHTFLATFSDKRCILVLGDMYELGHDSLQWHKTVGDSLNEQIDKIEFLITVGEDSRAISGAFRGRKRHFETKEDVAKFLHVFLHDDFTFFFKASRSMELETIADTLLQ